MRIATATLIGLAAFAAACSKNPSPTAPAPQPAPAAAPAAAPATASMAATASATPAAAPTASAGAVDMSGSWVASLEVQGQTIAVNINLARGANGYTGDAAPEGQPGAALSSLTISGNHVIMTFSAPDGDAVFSGDLSADRRTVGPGTLSYQGQSLPFTMTKH